MKKVLFFIDTLGHGGAEKVLTNLVNNLDKTKFDITVMTIFDSGVNRKYLNKDIKYKYIFKRVFRGNVLFFRIFSPEFLFKHLIKEEYDILVSYLEGNTARILSGCLDKNVKKYAYLHVEMDEKTLFYPWGSKSKCIRGYEKFDNIIGVSKTVLDSFAKNTKQWDNLLVKYNTVETDYIRKKAVEDIDDVIFDDEVFNIISVGRLINQKRYDRLLKIHNKLIQEGYMHKLYILGDGENKQSLQKYIDDNKLGNTAKLLGFRDNPWKYVKKADLFVCSSQKEGFSTAVTESLIVGTPVVTTLCSGMKEMLGESEYGLITDNDTDALYEGVKALISDKELFEKYKNQAKIRGEFFNTKNTVDAVELMFEEKI